MGHSDKVVWLDPKSCTLQSAQKEVALLDGCVGVGEVAVSDHRSSNPTGAELARLARC